MDAKLIHKLNKRKEEGTWRSLSSFEGMTDFCSNNYLGLPNSESSPQEVQRTGSRLISGNSRLKENVERRLADFFEAPAALVFNSGYDANIGLFSSLPQRGDTVFFDEYAHASIRDGLRLSHAKCYAFRHNDAADLERKITKLSSGTSYVVVESLYSMHGDFAPVGAISGICKRYGAYLLVDEAHAGGVFGDAGRAVWHATSRAHEPLARIVTFGKAYGFHGAAVLGSLELREYLVNFARSFIYTTALPEADFTQILERVENPENPEKQRMLQQNIALFRALLKIQPVSAENSPVQVLQFRDPALLKKTEQACVEAKLAVKAIYPPTVPEGQSCLRICIHASNTKEEIQKLVACLHEK